MEPAHKLMDVDEFLAWAEGREETWELVDGVPVMDRPESMSFTTQRHNRLATNIVLALAPRLSGRCRVWTESIGVRLSPRKMRRPDVMVDCGPERPFSKEAQSPTVLFEIVSPSSRGIDYGQKPEEYQTLTGLQQFVIVEPGAPACTLWERLESGWIERPTIGLQSALDLHSVGAMLTLAEVYADIDFEAG